MSDPTTPPFLDPPALGGLCANCGAPLAGRYCAHCGEERLDRAHLRFTNFARRAFAEFTDFEHSKLFGTLTALLFRPGKLTADFLRGKTRSYLGPLKMYLTVFGLSLVIYSIYQPAAIYDVRYMMSQDRGKNWETIIHRIAEKRKTTPDEVISELNRRWQSYISFSQLLYPLLLAAVLNLLYLRARRFYVEHLIFALHLLTFTYLAGILVWPVYALNGLKFSPTYFVTTGVIAILSLIYIWTAIRRVYGGRITATAIKCVVIYVTYFALTGGLTMGTLFIAIYTASRST